MSKILFPVDPSEYTATGWRYILDIAKNHKPYVEGIAIIDVLDLVEQAVTYFPLPQGTEGHIKKEEELLADARRKAEEELIRFKERCKEVRIRCSAKIMEGRPDFIIEQKSNYSDLIVMGLRNFFHFETRKRPETSMKQILGHVTAPVLGVPEKFRKIKRVLVAYDQSAPSARAVQQFVKIMDGNSYEIILLTKSEDENDAMEKLKDLEDYLAHHGHMSVTKKWISRSLRKTVEKDYLDQVDLVVCGQYSKRPVAEFFVGKFTQFLIDRNRTAIFVSQ
jgi:nucleotide-binding universal stress UspA family protein